VQVPLIDVAARKMFTDWTGRCPACGRGEFDDPALVDLEGGLVDVLVVLAEEVEVLHRALVLQDRVPDGRGVLAGLVQQALQVGVLHREGARERLVAVDVGRIGSMPAEVRRR